MPIPRAIVRVPLLKTLRTIRANAIQLIAPLAIMTFLIAGLLAASGLLISCSATQRTHMSGAFATCEKADLGAEIGSDAGTLLQDVGKLIKGNAADLETQLTNLAIKVGIDAVLCAITAAEAVLAPAPSTDGTPTVSAPLPGLVRARAWAGKQTRPAS